MLFKKTFHLLMFLIYVTILNIFIGCMCKIVFDRHAHHQTINLIDFLKSSNK